jgi:hypothetical protein
MPPVSELNGKQEVAPRRLRQGGRSLHCPRNGERRPFRPPPLCRAPSSRERMGRLRQRPMRTTHPFASPETGPKREIPSATVGGPGARQVVTHIAQPPLATTGPTAERQPTPFGMSVPGLRIHRSNATSNGSEPPVSPQRPSCRQVHGSVPSSAGECSTK